MKPLDDIDPDDLHLFTDPNKECLVIDGPTIFNRVFSHPSAPDLNFAGWYIEHAVGFNNGEAHRKLRKLVSELLSESYGAIINDAPLSVAQNETIATTPSLNIVEDICVPVVNRLIGRYLSIPDELLPFLDKFSAVRFHRELRIGQVKQFNAVVEAIYDATCACPDRARFAELIPIFLIARHTIIATYAMTIAECMASNEGGRLESLTFPGLLTRTAVPYIARVAPTRIEGKQCSYDAGVAYRCPVSTRLGKTGENELPSFGEPPRLCLGRTMTFIAWQRTAEMLNAAMAQRHQRGQRRYEIDTPVQINEMGDHPFGGDVRFL